MRDGKALPPGGPACRALPWSVEGSCGEDGHAILLFAESTSPHAMNVFVIRSVFVFASLSASIGIAHGAGVPRVDGTRLLDGMSRTDNTPYADAERHAMTGYLAGVADTSEGKDWCDNGRVKPGEIDSEVLGDLRKLPNVALRANAAGLVIRILQQKYPCR
ncbi:hypothetical protein LL999_11380 [Burkholderia ambifaria]|uniref:Rap1a/Tai family immunity protein n=2 Tax=Burkholderiaceae TaxID=119060 RepID=UPI001E43CE90|nr:Rap1a/Tai family immunity protein [Burkholderia ambifaria]UEP20540.1 hypothetical protein LL999_11380 [Burkholderia ambifaria]